MAFNILATIIIVVLIVLLVLGAIFQAEDGQTSHYAVRLLRVMIYPLMIIFGILLVLQVFSWF